MNELKEYISTIVLKFGGNNFEANTIDEYKKRVKESFFIEYGIRLEDDEIQEIETL